MYFEQRLQSKLNQTFQEAHFIYDLIQVLFEIFCKKGSKQANSAFVRLKVIIY